MKLKALVKKNAAFEIAIQASGQLPGGFLVVSRWCFQITSRWLPDPGGLQVICWWLLSFFRHISGSFQLTLIWLPGGFQVASRQFPDGFQIASRWFTCCLHGASRLLLAGFQEASRFPSIGFQLSSRWLPVGFQVASRVFKGSFRNLL